MVTALVVLAAWPLVHYGVGQRGSFNPWKGFGWAMYCVPPWHFEVKVRQIDPPQMSPLGQQGAQLLQQVQREFLKTRGTLGPLAKPDKVAETIFYLGPNVSTIDVYVLKGHVDRKTAMYVEEWSYIYRYQYPGRLVATHRVQN